MKNNLYSRKRSRKMKSRKMKSRKMKQMSKKIKRMRYKKNKTRKNKQSLYGGATYSVEEARRDRLEKMKLNHEASTAERLQRRNAGEYVSADIQNKVARLREQAEQAERARQAEQAGKELESVTQAIWDWLMPEGEGEFMGLDKVQELLRVIIGDDAFDQEDWEAMCSEVRGDPETGLTKEQLHRIFTSEFDPLNPRDAKNLNDIHIKVVNLLAEQQVQVSHDAEDAMGKAERARVINMSKKRDPHSKFEALNEFKNMIEFEETIIIDLRKFGIDKFRKSKMSSQYITEKTYDTYIEKVYFMEYMRSRGYNLGHHIMMFVPLEYKTRNDGRVPIEFVNYKQFFLNLHELDAEVGISELSGDISQTSEYEEKLEKLKRVIERQKIGPKVQEGVEAVEREDIGSSTVQQSEGVDFRNVGAVEDDI